MDIRRIPLFAEISKPSSEVIKVVYANDLAEIKAIDSQGNIIPFGGGGGSGGNISMLLPRLEELGTVIINGAAAGGNSDVDVWIDRNGYSGTVTQGFNNFSNPAISEGAGMTFLDGYSNGTSGAQANLAWTALPAGDYTFDVVFTGTGLTTVTRPAILRLT